MLARCYLINLRTYGSFSCWRTSTGATKTSCSYGVRPSISVCELSLPEKSNRRKRTHLSLHANLSHSPVCLRSIPLCPGSESRMTWYTLWHTFDADTNALCTGATLKFMQRCNPSSVNSLHGFSLRCFVQSRVFNLHRTEVDMREVRKDTYTPTIVFTLPTFQPQRERKAEAQNSYKSTPPEVSLCRLEERGV